jgi:hypothetical protein
MRLRAATYVATTTVTVLVFFGSGLANLVRVEHIAIDMTHLGYPAYFMSLLGTWKLLGAAAVAMPGLARAKEWAYAGMCFDLTGAVVSHLALGDGAAKCVPPLLFTLAVAVSWATRPPRRALAAEVAPSRLAGVRA